MITVPKEKDIILSYSPTESVYGEGPSKKRSRTVILQPQHYGVLREHDTNQDKIYYHLLVPARIHQQIQELQEGLLDEHDFERAARKLEVRENTTGFGEANWKIYPYAKVEPLYPLKSCDTHYLRFRIIFWESRADGMLKKGVSIYNMRSLTNPEGKTDVKPFHERKLELI